MIKKKAKKGSGETVRLAIPKEAWATLQETLEMDCNSSAFDKDLRKDIRKALDAVKVEEVADSDLPPPVPSGFVGSVHTDAASINPRNPWMVALATKIAKVIGFDDWQDDQTTREIATATDSAEALYRLNRIIGDAQMGSLALTLVMAADSRRKNRHGLELMISHKVHKKFGL